MKPWMIWGVAGALAVLALRSPSPRSTGDFGQPTAEARASELPSCPVMPDHPAKPEYAAEYQGKQYMFCCPECIPKFKADPAKYVGAETDAAAAPVGSSHAAGPPRCPVMPNELAKPYLTADYKGNTYTFCCQDCIPKFRANPDYYLNRPPGAASTGPRECD